MIKNLVLTLSSSLVLSGCWFQSHQDEVGDSTKVVRHSDIPPDFAVPSDIWNKIQPEGSGKGLKAEVFFAKVEIELLEKNEGVLQESPLKMIFPKGGGKLDLNSIRGHQRGTYHFLIRSEMFNEASEKKILFWSKTKKRKIDGESFGAGCGVLLDITDKYFSELKNGGIKVNSSDLRDVSLLGGVFFITLTMPDGLYVSQVTVLDSEHPDLFCEE